MTLEELEVTTPIITIGTTKHITLAVYSIEVSGDTKKVIVGHIVDGERKGYHGLPLKCDDGSLYFIFLNRRYNIGFSLEIEPM